MQQRAACAFLRSQAPTKYLTVLPSLSILTLASVFIRKEKPFALKRHIILYVNNTS